MKRFVALFISYIFITFIWAYLYNEIMFKEIFSSMTNALRDPPLFPLGFATMIIQTVVLYILYSKFFKGVKPFQESLTLIYLVGSFDILVTSLIIPATIVIEPVWKYVIIKTVYGLVHYGLVGIALVFVFKKTEQGNPPK